MRTSTLIAAFALSVPALAAETPPPVVRATVYPDGAMVVRAVEADCRSGEATAEFAGLPPALDPSSIHASATGNDANIKGLSVVDRLREKPYGEELTRIDAQLKDLTSKIAAIQRDTTRAQSAAARATTMRQSMAPFLAREAVVEAKPNLAAWTAGMETTRKAIEESRKTIRANEIQSRELNKQLEDLRQRRELLAGSAPEHAWDVRVALSCSTRTRVELSYVVDSAGWSPVYEARADEAAGTVALSMLALVHQATGEKWNDATVILSTSLSRRDARPPNMERLYLGANEKKEEKKVLVRRNEAAQHLSEAGGKNDSSGGEAAPQDQGLSVQLTIPGAVDVPGDGSNVRLAVETHTLPAQFSLATAPKVQPVVVHRAVLRNESHHPLLPGPIDLFNKGGYLGTTRLDRTAEHDDLKLAFGLDENVKVKRVVLKEQSSQTGLFGSNRRLEYGYRIELSAAGSKATKVEVQEHVPVSELDDVKVLVAKETTPGAQLVAADGIMTWTVPLQPGEKKNVELHFTIDIPSSYDSGGL